MSTRSTLIDTLAHQLEQIAARVEMRRKELGLSQQRLADACNRARLRSMPAAVRTQAAKMTRERIARIEMARLPNSSASRARALYPFELTLLAVALEVSADWLMGPDPNHPIIFWDPIATPDLALHVTALIRHHQNNAAVQWTWGVAFPYPLMTPEAAHAYNRALFGTVAELPTSPTNSARMIEQFDKVALLHIERLPVPNRTWTHNHLIFRSDLECLADGTGFWNKCSLTDRIIFLEHLLRLVGDPRSRINLYIVDDEATPDLRRFLRVVEGIYVIGETLVAWRDFWGNIIWSEHLPIIEARLATLRILERHASLRTADETSAFLSMLRDRIAPPRIGRNGVAPARAQRKRSPARIVRNSAKTTHFKGAKVISISTGAQRTRPTQ